MRTVPLLATVLLGSVFLFPAAADAGQTCSDWFKSGMGRIDEPQDTQMALFEPDCYAWRLFVAFNWPAKQTGCGPDPVAKLGGPGEVVWERWIPKQSVYLKDAKKPPTWAEHCGVGSQPKQLTPTAQIQALRELAVAPALQPPVGDISNTSDEEVRLNQGALEFITTKKLFSLTEQRKMAAAGITKLDFPPMGKEVKAHWIKLDNTADHSRYHTGVGPDGAVYGLLALHITTKDLPNWFWATFEHVDNETRWPGQHPREFAGWTTGPIDRFACEGKSPDCKEYPRGIGLEGTRWQNYRLKATQIDWVDSLGAPTIVVNSKIEGGFNQKASSCISCHALARIGDKSAPMPFFFIDSKGPVDPSNRPATFTGVVAAKDLVPFPGVPGVAESTRFMQLDFVWSLRNVCPEPGDPLADRSPARCRN